MSFMDDLLKNTLKHQGDCSPDATGEQYEKNVDANGCKEIGSGGAGGGAGVIIFHASCDFDPTTQAFSNVTGKETFAELKSVYDNDGLLWCRLSMNALMEGAIPSVVECPLVVVEADSCITFMPMGHMSSTGMMITIDQDDSVNVFLD